MAKKRSISITVLSLVIFLIGILECFVIIRVIYLGHYFLPFFHLPLAAFVWLGIGIFKLKEWARKITLYIIWIFFSIIVLLIILFTVGLFQGSLWERLIPGLIFILLAVMFFYPLIYFLNHPRIREQFQQEN